MTCNRRNAFTLIELLVVISIIALLIALLLPALAQSRKLANSVQSLSNVRSISGGAYAYANDHEGELPPGVEGTMFSWVGQRGVSGTGYHNLLPQERPVNEYLMSATPGDDSEVEVARAPNDDVPFTNPPADSMYEYYGTSYVANIGGMAAGDTFTYFGNEIDALSTGLRGEDRYGNVTYRSMKIDEIPQTSRFVILGEEGAFFNAWGNPNGAPATRFFNGPEPKWNCGFADGHASLLEVPQGEVWGDSYQFSFINYNATP